MVVNAHAQDPAPSFDPALDDADLVPLNCFPLHSEDSRKDFVRILCMRGEPALFEAVSHVWSSLSEPQAERCTAMGIVLGYGGRGKTALRRVLLAAIDEALAIDHPLPSPDGFESLDAWHEAAMACFARTQADFEVVVAKYAAVLDGRVPGE